MKGYNKPALSFEEQLNRLIQRGLIVKDRAFAISKLSTISYYRLSAYWYPFRQRANNNTVTDLFVPNTTFEECFNLYEFDRKLRLLVLDAIERIEVTIRTKITYFLGHAYGAFGHCNGKNFHPRFLHKAWLLEIEKETSRSSDEFVNHYKKEYSGFPILPIWMLTELMSLGSLSKLYNGMKNDDKRVVAYEFKIHYRTLAHWFHILTVTRNICAHHSRLWNREFSIRPEKLKTAEWLPPITPRNDRIFYVFLILRCLLKATNNGDDWFQQVNALIEPLNKKAAYRAAMGIPENWRTHPIWNFALTHTQTNNKIFINN